MQTAGAWKFAAPVPAIPTAADLAVMAKSALDQSDITILRCVEHGIAVPVEWVAHRSALRAFVAGASTATALPATPAYPAGT